MNKQTHTLPQVPEASVHFRTVYPPPHILLEDILFPLGIRNKNKKAGKVQKYSLVYSNTVDCVRKQHSLLKHKKTKMYGESLKSYKEG